MMMSDSFIGKGERSAQKVLRKLFPNSIVTAQVPLRSIIPESIHELGSEYNKHKVDLFVVGADVAIVVEVNLGHGSKSYRKWEVYKAHLKSAGFDVMTIEANECTHLFKSSPDNLIWDDYHDIINELERNGIQPQQ